MKHHVITAELLQAVGAYLIKQPYAEVVNLIKGLEACPQAEVSEAPPAAPAAPAPAPAAP